METNKFWKFVWYKKLIDNLENEPAKVKGSYVPLAIFMVVLILAIIVCIGVDRHKLAAQEEATRAATVVTRYVTDKDGNYIAIDGEELEFE